MIDRRAMLRSLACLLLAGCATGGGASGPNGAAASGTPVFELRAASGKLRPGWTEMPARGGGSLIVSPTPLLRPQDCDNAALSKSDSPALILSVKASMREALSAATLPIVYDEKRNNTESVVFMVDGQIVWVAQLGMPYGRQVAVRIGPNGLSEEEAKRCIDEVKRLGR